MVYSDLAFILCCWYESHAAALAQASLIQLGNDFFDGFSHGFLRSLPETANAVASLFDYIAMPVRALRPGGGLCFANGGNLVELGSWNGL